MKKTIFVISTLTLILAGCDSAEKTTQVDPITDDASQQEVVTQSDTAIETTPAEHATIVVTASGDAIDDLNLKNEANNTASTDAISDLNLKDQADNTASTQPANNDWQGTYTGVLPCADCDGIKTTLTLNKTKLIS